MMMMMMMMMMITIKKIILSHETINSLFMGELSNENDVRHVRYYRVIIIIYDASV
jgi:hypothetical protein